MAVVIPNTWTGVGLSAVVASPSSPQVLRPQHQALPFARTAQECSWPAAIALTVGAARAAMPGVACGASRERSRLPPAAAAGAARAGVAAPARVVPGSRSAARSASTTGSVTTGRRPGRRIVEDEGFMGSTIHPADGSDSGWPWRQHRHLASRAGDRDARSLRDPVRAGQRPDGPTESASGGSGPMLPAIAPRSSGTARSRKAALRPLAMPAGWIGRVEPAAAGPSGQRIAPAVIAINVRGDYSCGAAGGSPCTTQGGDLVWPRKMRPAERGATCS